MINWFLVAAISSGLGGPLGPMNQQACRAAETAINQRQSAAVKCREAIGAYSCKVEGHPGTYKACPIFDIDYD